MNGILMKIHTMNNQQYNTSRNLDLQQEKVINAFLLKNNFFQFFKEYEGVVREIDFNLEPQKQFDGVDFEIIQKDKIINIDSKTQTKQYLNNPIPTFCLELLFTNKYGKDIVGWFDKDNSTDYYLWGWIDNCNIITKNGCQFVEKPEDIHEARFMIISKEKLKNKLIELNILIQKEIALKYLKEKNKKNIYFAYEPNIYKFFTIEEKKKYKGKFPKNANFCYTYNNPNMPEKPFNLVLNISFYKTICEDYYKFKDGIWYSNKNGEW